METPRLLSSCVQQSVPGDVMCVVYINIRIMLDFYYKCGGFGRKKSITRNSSHLLG